MAWRSPTDPTGPPSTPGGPPEEPSARAELQILLLPIDGDQAAGERSGIAARTPRGQVAAKFIVPSRNAGQMVWAVTVITTLAIIVPAGVPYSMIAVTLAIELAGFVIGAVSAGRHGRPGRVRRLRTAGRQ